MFSFLRRKAPRKVSPACRERIVALFRAPEVAQAEDLLEQCTDDPFLLKDLAQQGADRLLFAMIRVSDGELERLRDAISQFRRDWRDLLVAADFADDVDAHRTWKPRRLELAIVERWMAGELPVGVRFGMNAAVEVRFRPPHGAKGAVMSLVGLEPEPRYLVELASGDQIEARQFNLQEGD